MRAAATGTRENAGLLEANLRELGRTGITAGVATDGTWRMAMVGADDLLGISLAVLLYLLVHMIDRSAHWTRGHW